MPIITLISAYLLGALTAITLILVLAFFDWMRNPSMKDEDPE